MKIHTDKLTREDLFAHVPSGCYIDAALRGSRKRARAFDVSMSAEPGQDAHGIKRIYSRNTGTHGGPGYDDEKAATYIEWGDWMVELLKIDPDAIVGYYDGARGFVESTQQAAPRRPARENAQSHADRWKAELYRLRLSISA